MQKIIFIIMLILIITLVTFYSPAIYAMETTKVDNDLIIINKHNNRLAYFHSGDLVRIFPVGTGRNNDLTPEGDFQIIVKGKKPYYGKLNIPGGSPNNPLGARWLGLSVPHTFGLTYGIHGTNNPASIGYYVSSGCIRMYNEDVSWLYDQVALKTKVLITNSDKDFYQLATENKYQLNAEKKLIVVEKKENRIIYHTNYRITTKDLSWFNNLDLYLINNELYLPLRPLADNFHYNITWHPEDYSITLLKEDNGEINNLHLAINNHILNKNNNEIKSDFTPLLINSRTYIPLIYLNIWLDVNIIREAKTVKIIETTLSRELNLSKILVCKYCYGKY